MAKFSTNTKTDVITHIGIIAALILIVFFTFFFVYLPWSTNHGQSITVPDLKGMSIQEMEDILDEKGLDFEVSDCTYVAGSKPLSIHSQYPKSGSSVKEGRKIYLTIVTETPPMVKIPDVIGRSTSSAKNQLLSVQLNLGSIEITPALEENTVLKIKYNGKEVKAGTLVPKGSSIVFVVGDGLGNQSVEIPDLIGKALDEAEVLVAGQNLILSKEFVGPTDGYEDGVIISQSPNVGDNKLKYNDVIYVKVSGNAPENETINQ